MAATLNLNTLRQRAAAFAKEFSKSTYEMGEAQDFIRGLCHIFELNHRRAVRFEDRVTKLSGKPGRIDGFFPGLLLVEMKSMGEDLDKAYIQATEYFPGLKDEEMPRCVLVSDFANLHLHNLETKAPPLKIKLVDLPENIEHFKFIAGYETIAIEQQAHINKEAAEKMAKLHDALKATGYIGKDLETYLVRLLFCLFAEDTGLFNENGLFLDYLINHTEQDGSDLHGEIVYNNFPWPDVSAASLASCSEKSFAPTDKRQTAIETAAQSILDARSAEAARCAEQGQSCSLAQLYAPNNMPETLHKAHTQLDKAVDAAYGYKGSKDDATRVAFLFDRYQEQLAR
jgi:hypothetical protein